MINLPPISPPYFPRHSGYLPALLLLLLAFLLAVEATFLTLPAAAQEDKTGPGRIDRRLTAGSYDLFVEAEASNLSLGTALVSVAVLDEADGQPVPGARVVIRSRHLAEGEEGWATALPVPERPEIYRARLKLDRPGPWQIRVDIDGPLGQVETEAGTVTIPEPKQYWAGSLVFAGMSLMLLAGVTYVAWSIRRAQRHRQVADER